GGRGWGEAGEGGKGGKRLLGRVGLVPSPALRIGVSAAYGPYLQDRLDPKLPVGKRATDYHQRLGMTDLEVLAGHLEVRGEGVWNTWETPTVGDLDVTGGYAEAKYAFSFGGYVAGRFDLLRFGKIKDSSGAERPWDADVTRFETGVGYRFNRGTIAKLVYQHNELDYGSASMEEERSSLVAAQLSVSF